MEFSSTQTFKPSQNLCSFILPQFKEKGVGVVLNGFYSLDLIFNNKPYFIIKKNGTYRLGSGLEPNAIRGYLIKINDKTFVIGEHGTYHLESKNKFDISSIYLFKTENITITYHIALKKYYNGENRIDELLPKPYYSEYRNSPEQRWGVYASDYGAITVPDNCTGIDIEADQNCVFAIDGQQIIIGETERFIYLNKLTTLEYKGHFNINATSEEDRIITKDEKGKVFLDDLSVTFFREGGEDEVKLDTSGIIGYFNTDTDSLKITEGKWYNKIAQTEGSTTSAYLSLQSIEVGEESIDPEFDGQALQARGGQISDFSCEDVPKVIYIVLKKDEAGTDNCIISTSKLNGSADGGFNIWQTNSFDKPDTVVDTPYVLGSQANTELFHCLVIARQNTVNTDGKNGVMFFADGVLMGFVDDNSYDNYGGKVSFLRALIGDKYQGVCATDAYIKAILIGTEEHSIKQILNNSSYLQKTYI